MRASAGEFVNSIMSECESFLANDIEHYQKSLDNIRLAQSKLERINYKNSEK